jgi:hypothetical protein
MDPDRIPAISLSQIRATQLAVDQSAAAQIGLLQLCAAQIHVGQHAVPQPYRPPMDAGQIEPADRLAFQHLTIRDALLQQLRIRMKGSLFVVKRFRGSVGEFVIHGGTLFVNLQLR